jgi:putative sigma-54 modulation protein
MNYEIQGVHYDVSDQTKEFIEKKLERIDFAKEYIIDLNITITRNKPRYFVTATVHFRWGKNNHVETESHELYEAIELMLDKLEHVVRREKKKVREEH